MDADPPASSPSRRRLLPLLLALSAGGGCLLLIGVDAWRHGGRPAFPAAWAAIPTWAVLGAVGGWILSGAPRRRWRELTLAAVATLATLGLAELLLPRLAPERGLPRLRGVRSQWLHHALPPATTMFAGLYDRRADPVVVRTNSDGLRSPYERVDYHGFPRRVAVVGDSFAFGWGVQAEDAWPSRLESLLREGMGEAVAVLNAGVFSYSPLLERRQWQRIVAAYRPQLVIQVLDATDVGDDWKYAGEMADPAEGPFPWADETRLPWRGAIWELLRPVLEGLRPAVLYPARVLRSTARPGTDYYDFRLVIDGVVETNRFFVYRHPLEVTRPWFEASWRHVERLAEEVRASGAQHVVVILPRFHHWNPREAADNWEAAEYRLDEPHAGAMFTFYAERARSASFPVIDLLPMFAATERFPLVFTRDPHLNEDGNAFVAEVLAPMVSARLSAGGEPSLPPEPRP